MGCARSHKPRAGPKHVERERDLMVWRWILGEERHMACGGGGGETKEILRWGLMERERERGSGGYGMKYWERCRFDHVPAP